MTVPLPPLGVGLALHANWETLEIVRPLLEIADFFEIPPEASWGVPPDGSFVFNAFADTVQEIAQQYGKPVVAHGLGLSPGTVSNDPADAEESERWLGMIARSQERFGFLWYLEHLGFTRHGGRHAVLPLPLAHQPAVVRAVGMSLQALGRINPYPGFENAAWYFSLDDAANEPRLYREMLEAGGGWLLLDLHNVHTHCMNFGLDWRAYTEALPLDRVLALHVSGGSESDADWLDSGRTLWLDSHDTLVPEPVWDMLAHVLPRCRNARGLVVERMEGTFEASDLPSMEAEMERARALWQAALPNLAPAVAPLQALALPPAHDAAAVAEEQGRILQAMYEDDPAASLPLLDADGVRLSGLLVQKLRFERLTRGDASVSEEFDADPQAFVEIFDRYGRAEPPRWYFPAEEARAFRRASRSSRP